MSETNDERSISEFNPNEDYDQLLAGSEDDEDSGLSSSDDSNSQSPPSTQSSLSSTQSSEVPSNSNLSPAQAPSKAQPAPVKIDSDDILPFLLNFLPPTELIKWAHASYQSSRHPDNFDAQLNALFHRRTGVATLAGMGVAAWFVTARYDANVAITKDIHNSFQALNFWVMVAVAVVAVLLSRTLGAYLGGKAQIAALTESYTDSYGTDENAGKLASSKQSNLLKNSLVFGVFGKQSRVVINAEPQAQISPADSCPAVSVR